MELYIFGVIHIWSSTDLELELLPDFDCCLEFEGELALDLDFESDLLLADRPALRSPLLGFFRVFFFGAPFSLPRELLLSELEKLI